MEVTAQVLFKTYLLLIVLQCLQGMSLRSAQPIAQPIRDSCSDTAAVESLIKAYTQNDNETLHRFLNNLFPTINTEFNFETVDDLITHLKEGNWSTLPNHTTSSSIVGVDASMHDKQVNDTTSSSLVGVDASLRDKQVNDTTSSSLVGVDASLRDKQVNDATSLSLVDVDASIHDKQVNDATSSSLVGVDASMHDKQVNDTTSSSLVDVDASIHDKQVNDATSSSLVGVDASLGDKQVNDTTRILRSSGDVRGSLKSSRKKSHRNNSSHRFNSTAYNVVNDDDSYRTSKPAKNSSNGDKQGKRLIENEATLFSEKEIYQTTQNPNSRRSDVSLTENVVAESFKQEEPSMICSPQTIIDILRRSLLPSISQVSRDGSSNKLTSEFLTLETHSIRPHQEIEESVNNSTPVMNISEAHLNNHSISDSPPISSTSKENIVLRTSKKTKDRSKHIKSPIIISDTEKLNDTLSSSLSKPHSTYRQSKKVKTTEKNEKLGHISATNIPTNMSNSDIMASVLLAEENTPKAIVEPLRQRHHHVSRNETYNRTESCSPNLSTKQHSVLSPLSQIENTIITNVSLDNLTSEYLSHSTSLPRRENYFFPVHGTYEEHPIDKSLAKNISPVYLLTSSSQPHSHKPYSQDDSFSKHVADNLHSKDLRLEDFTKMHHSDDKSLDSNNVTKKNDTTVAESSFLFDGNLTQADLSLRGKDSYISWGDNEDTSRDTRAKDPWENDALTSPRGSANVDDEPFRVVIPQNIEDNNNSSELQRLDFFPDDYLQDGFGNTICEGGPDDQFDDWESSCVNKRDDVEDIKTRGTDSRPHWNALDAYSGLCSVNDEEDGLKVARRQTTANYMTYSQGRYPTWQISCQPYLPLAYYWQYYQNSWSNNNYNPYVNYNVPPLYCPACPRSCSEPPPKPRPAMCQPCPPLFCSPQYRPPSEPPSRPKCPPCPKHCREPCIPRPACCKKCPPLNCPPVCPPCPQWCVAPGYPPRPEGCAPCPPVPFCRFCPYCGNNIGITVTYYCPSCKYPIFYPYSTQPKTPSEPENDDNPFKSNTATDICNPSEHFRLLPVEQCTEYVTLCPACPDKCVYPNYPARPPGCQPCPTKPACDRAGPPQRCTPCPEKCVPLNYPERKYGCTACKPLPRCSC